MAYSWVNVRKDSFQPCETLHNTAFQGVGNSRPHRKSDQGRELL